MGMYRKKPVVIEAFQWQPKLKPEDCPHWFMNWIGQSIDQFDLSTGNVVIPTLEGNMTAIPGDWIIRGIKGEMYPCKPDIFEATYEPA